MPANTSPIFTEAPDIQWIGDIVTANNTQDITTGTSYLAFTADATDGGYVREARVKANPANNTAATVMRFWLNNGGVTTTAANSAFIGELGIPATTASASAPIQDFVYPLNFPMPAGYKIYVTVGTAPGGSGEFTCTVFGGKY